MAMWNALLLSIALCVVVCVEANHHAVLVTHKVYFDIAVAKKNIGRIVIGVFGDVVPRTVENFVALATHSEGYGYKGSQFDWVFHEYMIQGGDISMENGYGGYSIFGPTFEDENFDLHFYGPGWVGMANSNEEDNNQSQFFILTIPYDWFDGLYVAFGRVLEGMDVVYRIEATPTNENDQPIQRVVITECGLIPLDDEPMYVVKGSELIILNSTTLNSTTFEERVMENYTTTGGYLDWDGDSGGGVRGITYWYIAGVVVVVEYIMP